MRNIKGEAESLARRMLRFGTAQLIYFAGGRDASSAIPLMEKTKTGLTTPLHRILLSHEAFSMSPTKICTDFNCGASSNSFNTSISAPSPFRSTVAFTDQGWTTTGTSLYIIKSNLRQAARIVVTFSQYFISIVATKGHFPIWIL